jgi:acetyl-CoA carboxylase biotin carboxyl carrier protein
VSDGSRASQEGQRGGVPSVEGIHTLAQLCQRARVEELEATDGRWSIRLKLDLTLVAAQPPAAEPSSAAEAGGPHLLISQWVGVFHRVPEGEPYAQVGRHVDTGDVLGVVVAMQLQHEVPADRSGRLLRFLVEDGMPVEYGQPLAEIE